MKTWIILGSKEITPKEAMSFGVIGTAKLKAAKAIHRKRMNKANKERYKADPIYAEALRQQRRDWEAKKDLEKHLTICEPVLECIV